MCYRQRSWLQMCSVIAAQETFQASKVRRTACSTSPVALSHETKPVSFLGPPVWGGIVLSLLACESQSLTQTQGITLLASFVEPRSVEAEVRSGRRGQPGNADAAGDRRGGLVRGQGTHSPC